MMRTLLVRGMLAGLIAGVLAAVFASVVGQPRVDAAISLAESDTAAAGHAHDGAHRGGRHHGGEQRPGGEHGHGADAPVSRDLQSTLGLFTATGAYGVAIGGLFAVGFAVVQGRISTLRPRLSAALLTAGAFVAVVGVPFLKYPANPPAVGRPGTIGDRTSLYFGLVALSLALGVVAVVAGRILADRLGAWYGGLLATGGYLSTVTVTAMAFPVLGDVPEGFSASLLWEFRLSSLATQLVLWTTLGLVFGAFAERVLRAAGQGTTPQDGAAPPAALAHRR